jgi:hypothetical protein
MHLSHLTDYIIRFSAKIVIDISQFLTICPDPPQLSAVYYSMTVVGEIIIRFVVVSNFRQSIIITHLRLSSYLLLFVYFTVMMIRARANE